MEKSIESQIDNLEAELEELNMDCGDLIIQIDALKELESQGFQDD